MQWGNGLLANVPRSKIVQPPPFDAQLADHGAATQETSLYVGPLLISACQLTERALHISTLHSPDKHNA
jgi:hypothetical protein